MTTNKIDGAGSASIFKTCHDGWLRKAVPMQTLQRLYEWGPTTAKGSPGRFVFVRTREGKARLVPHLSAADAQKVMVAPVCVIVAYDTQFHQSLGGLLPARQVRSLCDSNPSLIEETARRNCSVQGAYLMIGARVLGLDCELISGFNGSTLDAEFFSDQRWKSSFLCNLGYASEKSLFPANPRPSFDEACRVA